MNHEPDNLSSYGGSLKDCLISSASIHGTKKAISFFREGSLETEISYLELDRDSNRMANTFLNLGVTRGDRVVLYIPKSLFFCGCPYCTPEDRRCWGPLESRF